MPHRDPTHIYHFRRLNSEITTSGQPSEAQLKEIAGLGVTHVINLGMHDHEKALPDEAASVAALGIEYIHIPVEFDAPTELHFARFCEEMERLSGKSVHVHCIANLRVTAFLYRYQRDVLDLPDGEARALMDTVWRPGKVWAEFIGDDASIELDHRPPA